MSRCAQRFHDVGVVNPRRDVKGLGRMGGSAPRNRNKIAPAVVSSDLA